MTECMCMQSALDTELSSTTLVETFEKYGPDDQHPPSASLQDVDIEKNLLKSLLDSQASQMGTTGKCVVHRIASVFCVSYLLHCISYCKLMFLCVCVCGIFVRSGE